MLLVNARCGPSRIHGSGLIAREPIPAGTRIWEFRPGFDVTISEAEALALSAPSQRQLRFYAYFDLVRRVFVLSSDDDRCTNHSPEPNTRVRGGDHTEAARDIAVGEEITCDYRELGWTEFLGVPPGLPLAGPQSAEPLSWHPNFRQ